MLVLAVAEDDQVCYMKSLSEILTANIEQDFSPEKMRECAELLKSWKGKGKKKALLFSKLLEQQAKFEEHHREVIRRSLERKEYRPDYDEGQ